MIFVGPALARFVPAKTFTTLSFPPQQDLSSHIPSTYLYIAYTALSATHTARASVSRSGLLRKAYCKYIKEHTCLDSPSAALAVGLYA